MRVLLLSNDLYRTVGGGETVYRRIIAKTPAVDFYYFRRDEPADAPRPANAHALPLLPGGEAHRILWPALWPKKLGDELARATRYARAAAGQRFDVVECPDYDTTGSMIRPALELYGVQAERFVLAMHGNLSTSIEMNWDGGASVLDLREAERKQFVEADAAYAISKSYIEAWQAIEPRPVHYVHPGNFVDLPELPLAAPEPSDLPPSLYCIGRLERRKGNDIFMDLCRWLRRDGYAEAYHIGANQRLADNRWATDILYRIAVHRGLNLNHPGVSDRQGLRDIFRSRAVVVLPVRYDSFNLAALEALVSGCPVAVSNRAGVCRFLDEELPGVPYIKLDVGNLAGSLPALERLLADYDGWRRRLVGAVNAALPGFRPEMDMAAFYHEVCASPPRERPPGAMRDVRVKAIVSVKSLAARAVSGALGASAAARAAGAARRVRERIAAAASRATKKGRAWAKATPPVRGMVEALRGRRKERRLGRAFADINRLPEANAGDVRDKLRALYSHCGTPPLWRCTFWQEIARLERMRDNPLYAAVYEVRLLRLLGRDASGQLETTARALDEAGFSREARVLRAQHGPKASPEAVHRLLRDNAAAHRSKPDLPWERIVDRRAAARPEVSVIVSLYNAAGKLAFFLTALQLQTMYRRGVVEIILVDSGSPADEWGALQASAKRGVSLDNVVYARSTARETIQCAWNRGIKLARAPYLVFLGVDEGLYPDALERLHRELEADAAVDWCMGGSVVTEVDADGVYGRDVMLYDRRGATGRHPALESCYLAHVGGMYRRGLHDRFGYYDESFRGAGDTEFKMRILPGIRIRYLPETLGVFFNYPEARVTNSPAVEIEDCRAWYAYRTPGGVRYSFADRPPGDAEEMLLLALGYRKSYCAHLSCDIDYAANLAAHLAETGGSTLAEALLPDLTWMRSQLRAYNYLDRRDGEGAWLRRRRREADALFGEFRRIEARHRELLADRGAVPTYRVFNDNQFEQHSWLWIPE